VHASYRATSCGSRPSSGRRGRDAPSRESEDGKGGCAHRLVNGGCHEAVCMRDSGVNWIYRNHPSINGYYAVW